jgi:septum formation protein
MAAHDSIFAPLCQRDFQEKPIFGIDLETVSEIMKRSPSREARGELPSFVTTFWQGYPPLNHRRIVLASSSPYRRELLARMRLAFEVRAPDVDESILPGEAAGATALRLAQSKAHAARTEWPRALIIGCDQVAELDGSCLGKPHDHANAVAQLKTMRGKSVVFHTAVALLNAETGAMQASVVPTTVRFRDYADREIERYLQVEKPYDCAGSAKIEGLGIVLVESVRGDDPSALIGLPLIRLAAMLRTEGVTVV